MKKIFPLLFSAVLLLSCSNENIENKEAVGDIELTNSKIKDDSINQITKEENKLKEKQDSLGIELISAIKNNDFDLAQILLENGANPNYYKDEYFHKTALIIAVQNSSMKFVNLLLKFGANPDIKIRGEVGQYSAVSRAAGIGNKEILLTFIKAGSNNLQDAMSSAFCTDSDMLEIVDLLLQYKVPIKNDYIYCTRSSELVKLCLSHGADPNSYLIGYEGALFFPKLFEAVGLGDTLMVKYLLEAGANPKLELSEFEIIDEGSKEKQSPLSIVEKHLNARREKNSKDTVLYIRIMELLLNNKNESK